MTDFIPRTVLKFPEKRRKADCQGEIRTVSLRSPVMDQLLRSVGVDPTEWWVAQSTAQVNQGLKDLHERAGRAHVRELLLLKLEEFKA